MTSECIYFVLMCKWDEGFFDSKYAHGSFEGNSNNRLKPDDTDITVSNFWKLIYGHIQVRARVIDV